MDDPVRWLTYEELGTALNIERESARQLVKRKRWARRPGNDGRTRVGVPEEIFASRTGPGDAPAAQPGDAPGDAPADDPVVVPADDPVGVVALELLQRHVERLEREAAEAKSELEAIRAKVGRTVALEALNEMMEEQNAALHRMLDAEKAERDRWYGLCEARVNELLAAREALARAETMLARAEALPPRRRWWQRRQAAA